MTSQMILCLAIFLFFLIGFLVADKLKTTMGIVALCTIVLLAFSGLIKPEEILANFGNANAVLICSMYVIAAGFSRTQAVNKLSGLVYKVSGGSFRLMLAGYILIAFVIAQFIQSAMATFAILAPLVASMCRECKVSPSKGMFPVAIVLIGTSVSTPIGSGAAQFAQTNAFLESFGYSAFQMKILDPFLARGPLDIIIILYAIFLAPRFCPDREVGAISRENRAQGRMPEKKPALSPIREVIGYSVFILNTVCIIFQKNLGIPTWLISFTCAAIVCAAGVLTPREAIAAVPIRIVIFVVSTLSLGAAMQACGLAKVIGDAFAGILGGSHNSYVIGFFFFIVPFLLTQVMSNQTVMSVFRPIVILTCKSLGCNPIGPLMLLTIAAVTAFATPMATPAIPVVMEEGGYSAKDLLKMSWPLILVMTVASVFWVMTAFPAY